MTEFCYRCGKVKHSGICAFDKTKKSVIETMSDDIKIIKGKVIK